MMVRLLIANDTQMMISWPMHKLNQNVGRLFISSTIISLTLISCNLFRQNQFNDVQFVDDHFVAIQLVEIVSSIIISVVCRIRQGVEMRVSTK